MVGLCRLEDSSPAADCLGLSRVRGFGLGVRTHRDHRVGIRSGRVAPRLPDAAGITTTPSRRYRVEGRAPGQHPRLGLGCASASAVPAPRLGLCLSARHTDGTNMINNSFWSGQMLPNDLYDDIPDSRTSAARRRPPVISGLSQLPHHTTWTRGYRTRPSGRSCAFRRRKAASASPSPGGETS